jgi:HAE1 family hydrophobic/amphiphilic exporter-1
VVELTGYVRRLLGVDFPWSLQVDGKRERAQLAFAGADEIQMNEVADTVILTPRGEKVRLGDLVKIETQPMKGSVMRENQRYTMFLNWEFVGPDRMRRNYIKSVMEEMELPYGYGAEEATQEFFTEEEEEELTLMAVLAIVFIFMLMAALFESASLPLLVLLSIPFALSGVFLAFWLTHATFDSSARIGLVLLFGIVVNNAILLASRFRTESALILRGKEGGDPEAEAALFPGMRKSLGGSDLWRLPAAERAALLRRAVARGVRVRLRSILLTSGTTVAGLAPLLIHFRESEGRDIWENLALTSIGGLVSSTVLILIALPATYYLAVRSKWLLLRFVGWMGRGLRRLRPDAVPAPSLDTKGSS